MSEHLREQLTMYDALMAYSQPVLQISNVIGSGNPIYNTAYWEIGYIRTYSATTVPPGQVNTGSTTTSSAVVAGTSSVTEPDPDASSTPTDTSSSDSKYSASHEAFLIYQGLGILFSIMALLF